MDLSLLREPFPEADIEWRPQRSGMSAKGQPYAMTLAYISNRAVMDRLDEVCGEANWRNEFKPSPNGGIMCGISICTSVSLVKDQNQHPVYNWVTKWDGAENTKVEAVKGGLSGAMKRAAVQWGIGRYLYNLPATFGNFHDYGKNNIKIDNKWYKYDNPTLPKEFLPTKEGK